jgi:hypothetical protein
LSDWITLDETAALARCCGAGAAILGEVLSDGFKARRIGVTALLEGPLINVSVPRPDHLAELALMQFRRTPQHVEDLLARAIGSIVLLPANRLQACIAWHGDAPPYVADTIILCEVRLYRPALESALEEVGFTRADGTTELPAGVKPKGGARGDAAPAVQTPTAAAPGPKPGSGQSIANQAWQAALKVLADDKQRPPLGYGRLAELAHLVNAELISQGYRYQDDSIRKAIGPSLREWEAQNPDK